MMKCTIEILHDPNARIAHSGVGGPREEAEFQIRETVRKHGYDWTEVEAHILRPDGTVLEVVRWIPGAEALRRIAAGFVDVHEHFYGFKS
jgi:hypothetical protein